MDPIKVGHITNADLYLGTMRLIGRTKEFEIPEFSHKMVTHEALGMIGVLELPSRAVDALKAKVVFEYLDHDVERQVLNPTLTHRWQLHSYVDVFGADGLDRQKSHKLISNVSLMFGKSNGLSHKLGEMIEREIECSVTAFTQKVTSSDVPIIEYDVFAGIYRINGQDVWPQ